MTWQRVAMLAGILGLGVLIVALIIAFSVKGLQDAANVAGVVAGVLAIPPLAVGLVKWYRLEAVPVAPSGADVVRVKDVLVGLVADQWKIEESSRSLDDPSPMPVQWKLTKQVQIMDRLGNISSEELSLDESSDQIAALVDKFRILRRRRLVVVGGPGTGKTTLAIQLILQLLATWQPDEPVPVLLSLNGWDTEKFPRLHDWLMVQLELAYPALRTAGLGRNVFRILAARSQILPVLDGLDELSEIAQSAVIGALNRSLGSEDQLILTSRGDEFARAVRAAGDALNSAAVIEAQLLTPNAAADYLEACLPPAPEPEWDQILAALRGGQKEQAKLSIGLCELVRSPLDLWLLRAVYLAPGAKPADLLDPGRFSKPAALRADLFDQLIPALLATRLATTDSDDPFRPRHYWDPPRIRAWLGFLADYLNQLPDGDGQSAKRDFAWWELAKNRLGPGRTSLAVGLISFPLIFGCFAVLLGPFTGPTVGERYLIWALLISLANVAVIAWMVRNWLDETPGFANLKIRGRGSRLVHSMTAPTSILFGFSGFLAGTLGGWRVVGPKEAVAQGIVLGLIVAAALGLVTWAETPVPENFAATPIANWLADRSLNLFRFAVIWSAIALGLSLIFLFVTGALSPSLLGGALAGLWSAIIGSTIGRHHAWFTYMIVTYRLAFKSQLPRRLMPFLDDAHRIGLLRAVGPVFQFRHADLQDYLAKSQRVSITSIPGN